MINFNWEVIGHKKQFIRWSATWDGNHDNCPIFVKNQDMEPFDKTVFYEDENESAYKCGDIVANNEVARAICRHIEKLLRGDFEDCGSTHQSSYFQKLIGALSLLWD